MSEGRTGDTGSLGDSGITSDECEGSVSGGVGEV